MIIFILLGCIVVISFVILLIKIRNKKYINYLYDNSIVIKKLLDINKKYNFHNEFSNFNQSHVYDNEIFYNSISCEDYLIYQLQFIKYDVEKEIDKIKENNFSFKKYCDDVSTIKEFGQYTQESCRLNKKYLLQLEKKLFFKYTLRPILQFKINISLYCSKINGVVYGDKTQTFSTDHIMLLIEKLKNKKGNFYKDKDIWESICRVERGRVSNKMRFAIYKRDNYKCCICGRNENYDYLEIDHIKPIAKGGKSTYDNLQTLCRRCNKNKGDSYFN